MIPRGIGRLNKYVSLYAAVETINDYGEKTKAWTDCYLQCWAAIEPLVGREYLSGQQVTTNKQVKIVLRYDSGITPEHRIYWDARWFEINTIIDPTEKKEFLELMTTEIV